jgi:hypothetical protein
LHWTELHGKPSLPAQRAANSIYRVIWVTESNRRSAEPHLPPVKRLRGEDMRFPKQSHPSCAKICRAVSETVVRRITKHEECYIVELSDRSGASDLKTWPALCDRYPRPKN